MKAKVAVICCSFNMGKYIQSTVQSILRQTEESKQIIIADACSTDQTLQILESLIGVEISSKPDSGYVEGFWNGVTLANSDYLTQCCISDGYVDEEWLRIACHALDENPDVSLVWASPVTLDDNDCFGDISFPRIGLDPLPENFQMRDFWLLTGFHFPEGNFVSRKEVFLECFPTLNSYKSDVMEPYLEFSYNFHKSKYKSLRIPRVVNYGRIHEGQITQQEIESSKKWQFQKRYQTQMLNALKCDFLDNLMRISLRNIVFYISAYFGVKSRLANAYFMTETNIKSRFFLAVKIRIFSYISRTFLPSVYKSFV